MASDLYAGLPTALRPGMKRWIEDGVRPGGFLWAVLQNDLVGAVQRADWLNKLNLAGTVEWLYGKAPTRCYGSPEAAYEWEKKFAEHRYEHGRRLVNEDV